LLNWPRGRYLFYSGMGIDACLMLNGTGGRVKSNDT
jgi:hypothetical protein